MSSTLPAARWLYASHALIAVLLLVPGAFAEDPAAKKVFTVVGGDVGDGKPATSASFAFGYYNYAAIDSAGNLYISDSWNCRLRKVNTSRIISTVAGTGICGFSGDGGPAVKAQVDNPFGVAVDGSGDVLFSDTFNSRVRKVDASGKIATVAGSARSGYCGDGGPPKKACLYAPQGLVISGSDFYIADSGNCRVRRVAQGTITTVAGNGTCGYSGDGGPATQASLNSPNAVAIDGVPPSQTLWISDSFNNVIRRVNMKTGLITTWWGDGNCYFDLQHLCTPEGIAVDSAGNLFVADTGNERVLAASALGGNIVLVAGGQGEGFNGDGILATDAKLDWPSDVAFDKSGNVLIVDGLNRRVRQVQGSIIKTVAGGYLGVTNPRCAGQNGKELRVCMAR